MRLGITGGKTRCHRKQSKRERKRKNNNKTNTKRERKQKKKQPKKKRKKKKKRKTEKRRLKKAPSSLPSLRERSETPGALDRRALGITGDTRCPATVFRLRSALPVTGVLTVGGVVKNRYVYGAGAAQTPTRLLGGNVQNPSAVCKRTRHLDFPPKPRSNSI